MKNLRCRRVVAGVALLLPLIPLTPLSGLINRYFTPVNLVQHSDVILKLQLGPRGTDPGLPLKVLKTIQGKPPETFQLEVDPTDRTLTDALKLAFGEFGSEAGTATALFFGGDSSAAKGSDPDKQHAPVGMLQVGTTWFAVFQRAGGSGAFFGKTNKGALRVECQLPGAPKRERRVNVLKPTRFVLPTVE